MATAAKRRAFFMKSVTRTKGTAVSSLFSRRDTIILNMGQKRSALLFSNINKNVFSSVVLMDYLRVSPKRKKDIVAVLDTRNPKRSPVIGKGVADKVGSLVASHNISVSVILKDGIPHFDATYVCVARKREVRGIERTLVDFLKERGHQVGRYALKEDAPLYEIVESANPLLCYLQNLGVDSYGLAVTEDFRAAFDAISFIVDNSDSTVVSG